MRRGLLAVAVAGLLAAAGCGGGSTSASDVTASGPTATAAGPASACGPVEHPELQGGSHLIGDATPPVPYSSTPGTSGWHASGAPKTGVFGEDDALTEPELVLSLEHGQIVAAYDPAALPDDEVAELERLATGELAGRLTVTPFTERDMGAPLVLNAWATRQPCTMVDTGAVSAFADELDDGAPAH